MNLFSLVFEFSPWWLVLAIVLAVALAYFTYSKPEPWSKRTAFFLASIRFTALFLLILLLLNPFANYTDYLEEKPGVAVIFDNSQSMQLGSDSSQIEELALKMQSILTSDKIDFEWYGLESRKIDSNPLSFNQQSTDLVNTLEQVSQDFYGRNLGAIIMVTDGIINRGKSLNAFNSFLPVFTIGVGDTTKPADIELVEIRNNSIVYQGNRFPVEVFIKESGFTGSESVVSIYQGGKQLLSKNITFKGNEKIDFILEADTPGLKRYTVKTNAISGEKSTLNNELDFYVEVLQGKEIVLIVAPAPHPDITAIRSALAASDSYESYLYIPGVKENLPDKPADVVIWHHAFTPRFNLPKLTGEPAFWYILGPNSAFNGLAAATGTTLIRKGNQSDVIRPAINLQFSKFKLSDNIPKVFRDYPTLEVPYGEYNSAALSEALIFQQVGSLVTSKPLFSFFDNGSIRSAVLFGTGLWKWRIQESALYDRPKEFDQLVQKSVRYLSVRNDKRKFIAEPIQPIFQSTESVRFNIETYNDSYERIGGQSITIAIQDESGIERSFNFVSDPILSSFSLGQQPDGIYTYQAKGRVGEALFQSSGEFLVKKNQMEALNLQANHQALRDLSKTSNGAFFNSYQVEELSQSIASLPLKPIIHQYDTFEALRKWKWLLVFILFLFSLEWFLRRYMGSY